MHHDTNATNLTAALRVFIGECVHSIEQLEILLFLFRSDTAKTLSEIVEKLRNHPDSCQHRLTELELHQLIVRDSGTPPRFRFYAGSDERRRMVTLLAEEYSVRRHRVIDVIYAPSITGAESFSEAFKVRRDN